MKAFGKKLKREAGISDILLQGAMWVVRCINII